MGIIRVCLLAAATVAAAGPSRANLESGEDRIEAVVAPPAVSFLTAADGLPSESVEAIVQDRHGYLWIGTRGGLVRHEGHRLRVLRHDPEDPRSLPGNNIMSLHTGRDGAIWAGISDQGLVRIEDLEVTDYWPTRAAGGDLAGRYIWSIADACDGAVWVAFARGGVARIDPASGRVDSFVPGDGVPDDGFNLELRSGPDCSLWLLTLTRLYRTKSIDRPRFQPVVDVDGKPVPPQTAIAFDWIDGNRLVTAGMHGVHRFEGGPDGWVLDQWARTEASVTALTVAADGNPWFAEADRISRWADGADEPEVVVQADKRSTASEAIRGVLVPALRVDSEGGVWIGTSGRGIARLSPAWRGFRSVPIDEGEGPLLHLTAIEADRAGGLWLLDSGRGLRHLSSDGELGPLHAREAISGTADLRDLVAGPDGLRLLTDHSLLLFNPDEGEVDHQYGIDSRKQPLFRFIQPAEPGRYWLGTEAELLRIDASGTLLDRWSIESGRPRPADRAGAAPAGERGAETQLLDLQRGPGGEWWWLGTRTIARLGPSGAFEPVHVRDRGSNHAWLFRGDELWLAGDSELRRHSIVDGRLVVADRFVAGNGLPPGRIQRLLAGDDASVWLLMTTGLARLDPASRRFRVFSEREGLPAMRFASGAAAALPNGRFAAASRDGVLLVDPSRIDRALQPPPVHITSVRAGDRQWQLHPGGPDRIELAWNENSIEFGFATLSFLNPARNRARLRLHGWDTDWSELEAGDRRYYGNLAPGRYRFEVHAANAAGLWNREGDAVEVVVAAPPWRSTAAWVAYLTVGLALMAFALTTGRRRRRRRDLRERSRNQRELVDAQRRALGQLTRSLEPTALGQAIVDLVAQLTRASWVRLTFLHPALDGTPAIVRGHPAGPAELVRLRGESGELAELAVERSATPLPPEIQGRLALLNATASQMLDHSRLLVQGRQLADKAADASAAKSEFVAAVSHEIRTPLHALGGMLALLRETELAPEQAEIVRTLSRSTEQLRTLLDASLDLSRIEARALDVDHAPFELIPMLERVADLHAPNAHSKGLALRLRLHPALPAAGFGDEDRMAQVLGNLLSNAIKFTESGGIDVEARPGRPGWLVCSVSDTGPGIPNEARDRLFRPFEQLESAMTRRADGAGLGLAICRRLVAATCGTLEVESRRFGGTRFVVEWPVLQDGAAPRSGSALLAGLRVAADLPAPELRVLSWLGRCWGFRIVDLPTAAAAWRQVDVLIHGPAGVADPAPIELARAAGCARLCLSAEPEAGETWLRAPLNESRLVGALLALRFRRSPAAPSPPAPSRGRDRRPA